MSMNPPRGGMDRNAFLAALSSPDPAAEDALALQAGGQLAQDLRADMDTDEDPTTQEGDDFFLDPETWPLDKWKKGQMVTVRARVQSIGSKIGLTPVAVEYDNSDEDSQDSEDTDYDDED